MMENTNAAPGAGPLSEHRDPAAGTEIVFDTASGFSEEEQREIIAGLDALAGQDRLELPPGALKTRAKKRGSLFPFLTAGGGLLLLAAGVFLLSYFHDQEDLQIREGPAVLGSTERRLIQEIRRETAREISEKEREIADMSAKLEGVDAEFQNLQETLERMMGDRERELREVMEREIRAERQRLTAQNLSEAAITERMRAFDAERILRLNAELTSYRQQLEAERRQAAADLQKLQEEYRASLAILQAERVQILEASRIREANQRAQMEERINELSGQVEQSGTELGTAREELRRLSGEQERASLAEGQLAGFYTEVQNRIRAGQLKEASVTLSSMREFLDTPSFRTVRAIQSRRDLHLAAIAALQGMINEELRLEGAASQAPASSAPAFSSGDDELTAALRTQLAVLQAQNEALETAARDQERTITALGSSGSAQGRQLVELQSRITALQRENATKNQTMVEQDTHIAALQQENDSFRSQNGTLQTQTAAQTQQMAERDRTISTLRQESTAKDQQINTLRQESTAKDQQINTLRQESTAKDQQISTLRQESTAKDQQISSLNTRVSQFQQTLQSMQELMSNQ